MLKLDAILKKFYSFKWSCEFDSDITMWDSMVCFIQSVRQHYYNGSSDLKDPEFMNPSSFPYWFSYLTVRCFFICSFPSIAAGIILPKPTYVINIFLLLLFTMGNHFGESKWFSAHTCYAFFNLTKLHSICTMTCRITTFIKNQNC